jgi:glycosyltransferase involved in cell wall biosynthesis
VHPTIIIPCFTREKSLKRLLNSLQRAVFPGRVNIVLSLDGGYSPQVLRVAKDFKETCVFANVEIIVRETNIGLRNHILWCGDQVSRTGSVIILEDDLVVDPQFYEYARSAAEFYDRDNSIAGISLYAQEYNEYAGLPFKPLRNGKSCYFMKVACSWGQLWTERQWSQFRSWYSSKENNDVQQVASLPDSVKRWPESSWKKYYSAYLVLNEKYFVYPYDTYTTNMSDAGGAHIISASPYFQTSLLHPAREIDVFSFIELTHNTSVLYDSFMEPESSILYSVLGYTKDSLVFDCYGIKPLSLLRQYDFAITSKNASNYLRNFPLSFRPLENCIIQSGEEASALDNLYLVDTQFFSKKDTMDKFSLIEYLTGIPIVTKTNLAPFLMRFFRKVIQRILK